MPEEKYELIINNLLHGVAIVQHNQMVFVNETLADILGCHKNELLAMQLTDFSKYVHPLDWPVLWAKFQNRLRGETLPPVATFRFYKTNGSMLWIEAFSKLVQYHNQPAVLVTLVEINQRKKTEEALWESEFFNRTIMSSLSEGFILYDSELRYVRWNKFMEELTGLLESEVVGKPALELFPHLTSEGVDALLATALAGTTVKSKDFYYYVPTTGKNGWVSGLYSPLYALDGTITGVIASIRDVTARVKTENMIHMQKDLAIALNELSDLKSALDLVLKTALSIPGMDSGGIYLLDEGKECLVLETSTGLQQNFLDVAARISNDAPSFYLAMGGKQFVSSFDETALETEPTVMRLAILREGIKQVIISPIVYSGSVIGCMNLASHTENSVSAYYQDVFQAIASQVGNAIVRIKSENKLQDSLKEKEIMLKEIHHRVKNNMQIISSMINLKASAFKDRRERNILAEIEGKIRAMAMLHEMLYKNDNFSKIDYGQYIEYIKSNVFQMYDIKNAVHIDIGIKNIFFDINTAIPCTLIIYELLSNTIKYALTERSLGIISINIVKDNAGYTMVFRDNGPGFPENLLEQASQSLGLDLVRSLCNQLDGGVTFKNINGAYIEIWFPAI